MKKLLFNQLPLWTLLFASLVANAQNTWIGGFPGRETDWNIAANWSLNSVPDEWDNVWIPNTSTTTFVYPVITTNAGTVASITMGFDAYLTLAGNGMIGIENEDQSSNIAIYKEGILQNHLTNAGTDGKVVECKR